MKIYTELASSYDYLLKDVDYHAWYRYICSVMNQYVNNPRVVVELGCGTGRFGVKFSADDFVIYGIDKSLEMLRIAKPRLFRNFRIICADMQNFHLSKKVDFIFSVHDTMNYLLEYSDITRVFKSVKNIMHNKSIFMFDITTEYNIMKNFHGKTSHYSIRDKRVKWSNFFDKKKRLVHSTIEFIHKDETISTEEHIQRIYSQDEIRELLEEEKLEVLEVYGDHSFLPPHKGSIMINFITRKL